MGTSRTGGHAARILIVDDYQMMRVVLRKGLEELGFSRVDEACNGKEALTRLNEAVNHGDPFTIIFCDWNMPEATGLEVLNQIRANPLLKDLPFVMVTAESEQENVVMALRMGANDYIIKPISPQVLQKKVDKIMAKLAAAS